MTPDLVDCPPEAVLRAHRGSLVPALVGLAALTGLAAWPHGSYGTAPVLLVLDVAVGVAALAAVPLVLRRPTLAGVVLGVLAALSPAATPAATAGTFVAARLHPVRTSWRVAAASAAGHAVLVLWRPTGLQWGWWMVCDVAVHAALLGWGAYLRARASLLDVWRERAVRAEREQERRVDEARLAERTRIAREMHDSLAHRLSLLATTAGALEYRPDLSPEQVAGAAGVVREQAGAALDDLRTVVGLLRSGPDELAPQPGLADVAALVDQQRAAGTHVDLQVPDDLDLPAAVGLAVFRTCQEGLTNARRHAPGSAVQVEVARSHDAVRVRVQDDGPRGRAAVPIEGTGTGLVGLRERVELLGGRVEARPAAGGFVLAVEIPVTR
ncbi:sensor histidine kinase [Cellulomonas sp. 73-145]|uniref:sensor histidine kinase n=1 Tax=Cellulomonas sp. 73-145 TaxID=1895739 RepID=UPI0025B8292D|nr:sensor histidine kinase [Cellulomonas sp. 73-145]